MEKYQIPRNTPQRYNALELLQPCANPLICSPGKTGICSIHTFSSYGAQTTGLGRLSHLSMLICRRLCITSVQVAGWFLSSRTHGASIFIIYFILSCIHSIMFTLVFRFYIFFHWLANISHWSSFLFVVVLFVYIWQYRGEIYNRARTKTFFSYRSVFNKCLSNVSFCDSTTTCDWHYYGTEYWLPCRFF